MLKNVKVYGVFALALTILVGLSFIFASRHFLRSSILTFSLDRHNQLALAASATGNLLTDQEAGDNFNANFSVFSQKYQINSLVNVCCVDLLLRAVSSPGNVQLRSDSNGGGTVLGTSNTGVDTGASGAQGGEWYEYDFPTDVAVSADVFVTLNDAAGNTQWVSASNNPYNPAAGYDAYYGSSPQTGVDFSFKLYSDISSGSSGGSTSSSTPSGSSSPGPDTNAPNIPSNFSATPVSSSQINLNWSPVTDSILPGQTTSGLAGYKIYRCQGSSCSPTIQVGTAPGNLYTDSNLSASTAYTYAVSAYDNATPANESQKSFVAVATTQAQSQQTQQQSTGNIVSNLQSSGRITDWSHVGVPGGIPNRTTICANVKDPQFGAKGDDMTDDTLAIVAAIASCGQNQVVYFPAGTYKFSEMVVNQSTGRTSVNFTYNNLTFRGAGMGKTVFDLHTSDPITIGNGDWPVPTPTVNVTGGAVHGSATLSVDNPSAITVGKLVTITETNPTYVHFNSAFYGSGPSDSGHDDSRLVAITALVTAKNGNSITINHPLPIDMPNSPMITLWNQYIVSNTGFEDMTFDMTNSTAIAPVEWLQAYGCWMKGIEVAHAPRRQVLFFDAVNCEVRDSYFHDSVGGGPNHEGIDFDQNDSWNLIENNVSYRAGYPMVMLGDWGGGDVGNVVAYNYLKDENAGTSIAGASIGDNHGPHNMFNLFEGNVGQNFASDGYYGSASDETLFRNYFNGQYDRALYMDENAINLEHWSTSYNIIGDILGTSGGYSSILYASGNSYQNGVIYRFGYPNMGNRAYSGSASNPTDPNILDTNVQSTAIIHGTYDFVTQSTTWDPGTTDHTLPASMYLSSTPSWWGSVPWPAIGPDVSGLTNKIPAQVCYEQGKTPNCLTGTQSVSLPSGNNSVSLGVNSSGQTGSGSSSGSSGGGSNNGSTSGGVASGSAGSTVGGASGGSASSGGGVISQPASTSSVSHTSVTNSAPTCPQGLSCTASSLIAGTPITEFLVIGSSDAQVTEAQKILSSLGYLSITPTGYYGTITEGAVKAFQRANNISPVGTVGPLTRAALNKHIGATSQSPAALATSTISSTVSSSFTRPLTLGSTGPDVKALQQFLNNHGCTIAATGNGSPGNESTYFGIKTQQALARYQSANGITPAAGYFGPKTMRYVGGH